MHVSDEPQVRALGARTPRGASPPVTGSETILLVEDDPEVRRVTAMVLRRCGYAVLEAEAGSQALALCAGQEGSIHLLVTDLAMPHMNGLELVERLRRLAPAVKALCVSGYLDEAELDELSLQFDAEPPVSGVAFLPKPFLPDELARRVRQVLDGETEIGDGCVEVSTTQFKRCDVVRATGRIDSHNAPRLADAFNAIINANRFKIVFDMEAVEYISSAGLRAMIDTQKTCKRWTRGELLLAGMPAHIRETMDLVGFVPLFRCFDNVTTAVATF